MLFSMLASPLPPYFLDTYSLSTSSLGCNALCRVISFLVLWSIWFSYSLVHFKKGLEYLTRGTARVFNPLISFLLLSFVSNSSLVILRYSFLVYSFFSTCLPVSASMMLKYLYASFSLSVLLLSWLGSSIPSVRCCLPFFISRMVHFSMPNSIPMSWLYILCTCIRVYSFFLIFCKYFDVIHVHRWLIFSCKLLSLYPAVHFLSIWLSGIMVIMNSNGDSASSWNMPLWTFASAKLLPPAVNYTFQVFMVLLIKFMTSSDIIIIINNNNNNNNTVTVMTLPMISVITLIPLILSYSCRHYQFFYNNLFNMS